MPDSDGPSTEQRELALLAEAIQGFLAGQAPHEGYILTDVAGYRALVSDSGTTRQLLLIQGVDGQLYVPSGTTTADPGAAQVMKTLLGRLRYRETTSTLTLRLPESLGGVVQTCGLWASPRYLAASDGVQAIWK